MKATETDRLIEAIVELRTLFPDWRLGQMMANLLQASGKTEEGMLYDVEDGELLNAARRLIDRNRQRDADRHLVIE